MVDVCVTGIPDAEMPPSIDACSQSLDAVDDAFNFDSLLTECLGEFGLYQKVIVSLLCLPACFFSAFHNYDMVFLAYSPDHHCKIESSGDIAFGRCDVKRMSNGSLVSATNDSMSQNASCNRWTYDTKHFVQTLVTEWDLVCQREIIIRNIISLTWLADLFSILLSYIQDQWGRKVAFILCLSLVTTGNLLTVTATDFFWFTALKCASGLNCMFNICLCWSLEFVGPSKRTLVATILNFGFVVATTSMVLFAYVGRTWRQLTLIFYAPFLVVLAYSFWMPESPRWLFTQGKIEDCIQVFSRMARWNGMKLSDVDLRDRVEKRVEKCKLLQLNDRDTNLPKSVNHHVKDFVKSSNLRLKLILLTVVTSIGSQIYTAVPFNVENLPSDFLISFLIQSVVEAPAMLISMYVLNKFGRVCPLALFTLFAGLICLLTWPFGHSTQWLSIVLSSLARFFIGITVPIAYQLANELYPTVVRGLCLSLLEVVHSVIGISVQYILFSRNRWEPLPMILMGSFALISGIFVFFLPETKDQPLPDTLTEAESIGNVDFSTFKLNLHNIFRAIF